MIPYNIKSEAGKELWTEINNHNGSSVWGPVGDGIVKIEREERIRAVKIVMAHIGKVVWQAKTDQESIDMTEMYEAIMGEL